METPVYELYCEDFSDKGWALAEICANITDGMPRDTICVDHENLRIIDRRDLQNFLLDKALTSNVLDESVWDKLNTMEPENVFEFKGDGDGLGFMLDIWENERASGDEDPIHSYQFWFDDYND
jgi:hypothetical protein